MLWLPLSTQRGPWQHGDFTIQTEGSWQMCSRMRAAMGHPPVSLKRERGEPSSVCELPAWHKHSDRHPLDAVSVLSVTYYTSSEHLPGFWDPPSIYGQARGMQWCPALNFSFCFADLVDLTYRCPHPWLVPAHAPCSCLRG